VAVKLAEAMRKGGFDLTLGLLARTRVAAVVLAFALAILDDVADGAKPHELLPTDPSVSPQALLAFGLVFAGAALRFWAHGYDLRARVLAQGPYAVVRHPLHLGSALVVIGLLLQLNDGMNWFVLPVFILFYGASLIREERTMARSFSVQWQSYKADVPAVIPSLNCLSHLRLRGWQRWNVRPSTAAVCTSLALVCLPWVIELLVEDLLCEVVLGV